MPRALQPLGVLQEVLFARIESANDEPDDLLSGYYQIPVAEKDKEKTAFITPDGLYEFTRMPQGVLNGPACFQRLMDRVLRHLKWSMRLVYLDDCLVFGSNFDEFLERLHLVLTAIGDAGLTINPKKCVFATESVFHLGHVIDAEGIRPNPEKVSSLSRMVVKSVKTLRSFIGVASFFRKFVPGFSVVAQPLFILLKKNVPWNWGAEQEEAKKKLVELLSTAPVLAHYNEDIWVGSNRRESRRSRSGAASRRRRRATANFLHQSRLE